MTQETKGLKKLLIAEKFIKIAVYREIICFIKNIKKDD